MQKKILAILILFIMVVTFSGCAKGNYSISIYDNGRIVETFYIELNQTAIELAGYDYMEVQNEVLEKFENVRNNLIANFNNNLNNLTLLQKNQVRAGIRMPSVENNMIGVSFVFDKINDYSGYDIYKLFYGVVDDDEEDDNKIIEENIFFRKITTTSKTAFQNAQNSSLANQLLAYFSDPNNGDLAFTLDDVEFSYSYATASTKLYSNADRVYKTGGGLKVHEWDVPSSNYDVEIEFYQYQIISTWWYVLAIVLTIIFILGVYIYHKYETKKNNKVLVVKEENVIE